MTLGVVLHPSLNEKEAWLKRYESFHNVPTDEAELEYRRRRRALSRFDIKLVEFFSDIEKDPTDPINLRAIMSALEAK